MVIGLALILFTLGAVIAAAFTDFLKLKIPNIIPIIVAIGFVLAWGTHHQLDLGIFQQSLTTHLIVGGCMFFLMITLFFLKLFGGGDAKLIPAVALWVGTQGLPAFLFITTVVGGLLAVISIILRKTTVGKKIVATLLHAPRLQRGWIRALSKGENVVPYGVAIAVGTVWSFRSIGLLP